MRELIEKAIEETGYAPSVSAQNVRTKVTKLIGVILPKLSSLFCGFAIGGNMSKKYDVVALGELLIDFTQNGLSSQGNTLFEANPGGAPCNVLAVLQKLGHQTAFIGKVGNDIFGKKLCDVLDELGIDRSSLVLDKEVRTTLAFVETTGAGDTFGGACLHYILEHDFMHLDKEKLKEMLVFANAAASIITTRRGALRVMPEKKEIEKLILAERR